MAKKLSAFQLRLLREANVGTPAMASRARTLTILEQYGYIKLRPGKAVYVLTDEGRGVILAHSLRAKGE